MISHVYSAMSNTKHKPQSLVECAVIYVNDHLFEDISVPSIAKHFYLSPSQFSRIFKLATGAVLWEYITRKRLAVAKEKIRSSCSARNVCETCGFGDYSAFYRAYVKYFGYAPKDELNNTKELYIDNDS